MSGRDWASFLNNATRGFGRGIDNYEQLHKLSDDRKNRADMRAAVDAQTMAQADTDVRAVNGVESFGGDGKWYDDGGQRMLPTPAATAVPTTAPKPTTAATKPTTAAPAKASAPAYAAGATATAVGTENGATKKNASSALAQVVSRMPGAAVDIQKTGYVSDDAPRAEHWDKMKESLSKVYIRNGQFEELLGLDEKIAGLQQTKLKQHLEEAMRVVGADPEAAARALYQAYSYYPDGVDVDIRIQDGKLIGYGYDEVTGEFKGGTELTAENLARVYESISDPAAFHAAVKAERAAMAELNYQHNKDAEELKLERDGYNLDVLMGKASMEKDRALALKYTAQALTEAGLNGDAANAWDIKDLRAAFKDNQTHIISAFKGETPRSELQDVLYSPEGPIGQRAMIALADSITSYSTPENALGSGQVVAIVEKLAAYELKHNSEKNKDLDVDKLMKKVDLEGIQWVDVQGTAVEAIVDGEVVVFDTTRLPNLRAQAIAELQEASEPAPAVDPGPTVEAPPPKKEFRMRPKKEMIGPALDYLGNMGTGEQPRLGSGRGLN